MAEARLLAHCGAEHITRADLAKVVTPPATASFKPVPHHELVDGLHAELETRGIQVKKEQYAIQHDGTMLFGTMDLRYREDDNGGASIGIRTANDRKMSLQLAIGRRIFVCDNMCFSGELIALKRRHTSRLDLGLELHQAIDRYEQGVDALQQSIEELQEVELSEEKAKIWIYDIFAKKVLPITAFPATIDSYHKVCVPRYGATLWALHNAVTYQVHAMKPGPAFKATVALGKAMGLR